MVVAACAQAQKDEPGRTRSAVSATRPPRLNFAGLCLRCDERGCESPVCLAWHEASCWMVCPRCGGRCWSETLGPCGCMFGVVEAWPAGRSAAD
jgi:hypothetical protein